MPEPFPLPAKELLPLLKRYPTPFYLYDEISIRATAQRLQKAFRPNKFRNFFAVKALPNPAIMKILSEEGMGMDCSSYAELVLAEKAGIRGENIMFSSNNTAPEEFRKARELGAIINLDDVSHISMLEKNGGIPQLICFRYNPGPQWTSGSNMIIGKPEEAKFGCTKKQLFEGYEIMKKRGVKRFGIHCMIASNVRETAYFAELAGMMVSLVEEIQEKEGLTFEFINLGGGLGIPYRLEEKPADIAAISSSIQDAYRLLTKNSTGKPPALFMESGRYVTGPYGWLITKVIHLKETYKKFIGVDASMHDLMRPGMYGAYHHITVLGKEKIPATQKYDVAGSLCENNDKFAVDRLLPVVKEGDILIIHDAGAHGHSMGFNYNGKLRCAELLLKEDGSVVQIRRAETVKDYMGTLCFTEPV